MIAEHDRVILTVAHPAENLVPGDVGTVLHTYKNGAAYEVEFFTLDGKTAAVVTLEAAHVRAVTGRDISHARPLASA